MIDDQVVNDTSVEVPQRGDCARFDNGPLRIVAGEGPHRVHRGPPTDHGEFDRVDEVASNEIGTEEPFDPAQLRRYDVSEVLWIGVWPVDVGVSTPFSENHAGHSCGGDRVLVTGVIVSARRHSDVDPVTTAQVGQRNIQTGSRRPGTCPTHKDMSHTS